MGTLLKLEGQPRFPVEDLTADNAMMLELLLANDEMVSQGHAAAERMRRAFQVGHQSILRASYRLDYGHTREEALDKGASMYEAMSALVNVTPRTANPFKLADMSAALERSYEDETLRNYALAAYECFRDETPMAAEVVRNASRLGPATVEYAVLGAALSRHFELDTHHAA